MMQQRKHNSHTLPWPADWDDLFGAKRPLIVEIGFGNGDYTIALAKANPDCNVIGFEVASQSMYKAERKMSRLASQNAIAIHSRGETALHHLFTPQSIREVHINYPDPWFKSRHAGRRIMRRDTLDAIVNRLEPGGLFFLATDIREYAEMSDELLQETPGLENQLGASWLHDFPDRLITTKYEEKGLKEGRPGHYFKYRRNSLPAPTIPVQEELFVPHIIIRTPMQPRSIVEQFEKMAFHSGDIHVAALNGYWNPKYQTILFDVVIEEPTIEQHIALTLVTRENPEEYTLKYASFGMPRPTEGMHHATNFLAEWVIGLHPEAEILSRRVKV